MPARTTLFRLLALSLVASLLLAPSSRPAHAKRPVVPAQPAIPAPLTITQLDARMAKMADDVASLIEAANQDPAASRIRLYASYGRDELRGVPLKGFVGWVISASR